MRGRGTTVLMKFRTGYCGGRDGSPRYPPQWAGGDNPLTEHQPSATRRAQAWAGTATEALPARVSHRQSRGRTLPTCESSSSSSSKVKARNLELCQYSSSSARTLLICNGTARLPQQREGAAASGASPPPPLVPVPPPPNLLSPRRPSRASSAAVLTAGRGGVGRGAARGARRDL